MIICNKADINLNVCKECSHSKPHDAISFSFHESCNQDGRCYQKTEKEFIPVKCVAIN